MESCKTAPSVHARPCRDHRVAVLHTSIGGDHLSDFITQDNRFLPPALGAVAVWGCQTWALESPRSFQPQWCLPSLPPPSQVWGWERFKRPRD